MEYQKLVLWLCSQNRKVPHQQDFYKWNWCHENSPTFDKFPQVSMETWLFIHADNYDRDKKPQIVPKNMQCKFHQNDQMYLLNWRFLNILVICHRKWRHSTQMLLTSLPPSEMLTQRFSNVIRIRKNYYMIIMLFVFKGRIGEGGGVEM